MAERGKLIVVMGDEDTVTGFLLGGIGEQGWEEGLLGKRLG